MRSRCFASRLQASRVRQGLLFGVPPSIVQCSTRFHSDNAASSSSATTTRATASHQSAIPSLSFLRTPTALLENVSSTLGVCQQLLDLIGKTNSPQDCHDLIDTTSNVLCLLLDPCEFVRQIHPSEAYKSAASEAFQRGYEFMSEANSRRDLYEVICRLDSPEGHSQLNAESIKNVIQLRRDMESNGIHLGDRERAVVTQMNIRKEELSMEFVTTADGGKLQALLQARYELARLLGFESYAQQQLRGTMLETPSNVWQFLCSATQKYREAASAELQVVRRYVGGASNVTDDQRAEVTSILRREAEPAEASNYFSVANCIRGIECLCSEVFGVRLERVPFESFECFNPLARKYYVYDEEKHEFLGIILLDMYMNRMKYCQAGHLTLQLGCRPHQNVVQRVKGLSLPDRQYPIVALTCNVASSTAETIIKDFYRTGKKNGHEADALKAVDDETTLMQPHEVTTLFHEFGHAMHTIFGQTKVQNLAGTRSSIDYVETFSQFFEQFLTSHEFLKLWARHYQTKEPISKDLVEQRNKAASMFSHLDRLDQVMLSAVDQVLHGPHPPCVYSPSSASASSSPLSPIPLGPKSLFCDPKSFHLPTTLIETVKHFSVATPTPSSVLGTISSEHVAGYPGGYYGYLYSLTIAQRIWEKKFALNPLSRTAGRELVHQVMSLGAACDPKNTLENYLGESLESVAS